MKHSLLFLILAITTLSPIVLDGQCSCDDCPFTTISNGIVESTFEITGATNNVLGANGQFLQNVYLDFISDAINEIDITIIAPNGSSIILIKNAGISTNEGIVFHICFLSCNLSASPDPGFSAEFDSNEPWQNNGFYSGSYYPSSGSGCLEDLTGPVNGTWTLRIQDFINFDDCTFSNWNISFADNNGTECSDNPTCSNVVCEAYAGILNNPDLITCAGDSDLDLTITPSYTNPPAPDPDLYDYTYIISDLSTGVIIEYSMDPDLTTYPVGEYSICGLSYFTFHEGLIPAPNDSYTIIDFQNDIENNLLCGDITTSCIEISILDIPDPIFTGPIEVCVGETVSYTLENPGGVGNSFFFQINSGGFDLFDINANVADVIWNSGPGEICVIQTNICGSTTVCLNISVEPHLGDIEINGPGFVCQGDIETYQLSPALTNNLVWDITITNGTVIEELNNTITIQWNDVSETGQICANIEGSACNYSEFCLEVDLFEPPIVTDFTNPFFLCLGEDNISFVENDPNIISYDWTLTNLIEITGNGTPFIQYSTDQLGIATVCLQIETFCGIQDEICKSIIVIDLENPEIIYTSPVCDLNFTLTTEPDPETFILWSQIGGPPGALIVQPNNSSTFVNVILPGTYTFQLDVELNDCFGSSVIDVIVGEAPIIVSEDIVCDENQNYIVSFEIQGISPPFFVNNTQLIGSNFTSDPIISGDNYSFNIWDENNCTTSVSGTFECDCDISGIENILNICNLDETSFVLSFDVLGGVYPLTSNIEGTFFENHFVSNNLDLNQIYTIIITDASNCSYEFEFGPVICDCTSEAGVMSDTLLEVCGVLGNSVQAMYLGGEILDEDDTFLFVLHDNPGTIIGNIISTNKTGIFDYQVEIDLDALYYISYVVGNELIDSVDMNHPCTVISIGQPVIFHAMPYGEITDTFTSCFSTLDVDFSVLENTQSIIWKLISGPTGATIEQVDFLSTFDLPDIGTYLYSYELINGTCNEMGQITIIFNGIISVNNVEKICEISLDEYVLELDISGGETPYSINIPGSFDGSHFTSQPLDINSTFTILIQDVNGCTFEWITNPVNCDCDIDLGTIITDTIRLCENDILEVSNISNQDFTLEEGVDTFAFLIYESPAADIDDYIYASYGTDIEQIPNFDIETFYYIRFLITSFDDTDNVSLDFDNPCLQHSNPIPIIWHSNLLFNFDLNPTACTIDGSYYWIHTFPGPFPYSLVFSSSDGTEINVLVNQADTQIGLPIEEGDVAWEIIYYDGICGYQFTGNIIITGEEPPLLAFHPIDTICNNNIFDSQIDLYSILFSDITDGIWAIDGIPIIGSLFDFDGFTEGDHTISFSNLGSEGSCPVSEIEGNIYVKECMCPIVNHIESLSVCSTDDPMFLTGLFTTTSTGIITINNQNNLTNPPIISTDNKLIFNDATEGDYFITFEIEEELPNECKTVFEILLYIEKISKTGESLGLAQFCEKEEEMIYLHELITDEDPNGDWKINNEYIGNPISVQNYAPGTYSFNYSFPATALCPENSTDYSFEIIPNPIAYIQSEDVFCFGEDNGSIEIIIESEDFGPFTCTLNGQDETGKTIENLPPGKYTISVTNAFGCNTFIEDIIIEEPEILSVNLGGDFEGYFNDQVTIEAIINLLQSDIDTFTWEDLNGLIENNGLSFSQNLIQNNTITFSITDINGCVAFDAINIRVLEKEITLANIINPNSQNSENRRFGMPYLDFVTQVIEFRIFDRWGNQVFIAQDVFPGSDEGYWKGDFNGSQVMQGVFCYFLIYENVLGKEKIIIGDVTVVK